MDAVRERVRQAALNGVEPYYAPSGNLLLKIGNARKILMRGETPSELGHVYFGTLGRAPPRGFQLGAIPYRQGRTEYIATPGGDRAVRRWNPVTSSWKYTALGRSFFGSDRQETVVHVPITVHGVRSNGSRYEFTGHMPVDDESTRGYQGNMQALKQSVLATFEENRMYEGARVLHEASQEIWVYNPQGQWE